MQKITYWHCADNSANSRAYDVRVPTKREALDILACNPEQYSILDLHKVTLEYYDRFDLLQRCLGEGTGGWEDTTPTPRDELED